MAKKSALKFKGLENRVGALSDAASLFVEGSLRNAAQLTTERRFKPELRDLMFYTADCALYMFKRNEPFLYFGCLHNPIFKKIEEACNQLWQSGRYIPPDEDVQLFMRSALPIPLSQVRFTNTGEESASLVINTSNFDATLNPLERKFAEAVFDEGREFIANMGMFASSSPPNELVGISVLNDNFLRRTVPEGKAIVRPCLLSYFSPRSNLIATIRYPLLPYTMRGIPLIPSENPAQRK